MKNILGTTENLELLQDIQKNGAMVYSEKTMAAFRVFMVQGSKLFAPVDQ